MKDFIARLEAAEVGSAELDYLIDEVFSDWRNIGGGWAVHKVTGERVSNSFSYPDPVTTSIDAALVLAERVLPEWAWEIRLDLGGASVQAAPVWWMEGLAAPDEGGVSCDGKTPALALCIAILRAKESQA